MRNAASDLFGLSDVLQSRPNVFGELMRFLVSPSKSVEEAVNWVLGGEADPDISLHMRMLMNKYSNITLKFSDSNLCCVAHRRHGYILRYRVIDGKIWPSKVVHENNIHLWIEHIYLKKALEFIIYTGSAACCLYLRVWPWVTIDAGCCILFFRSVRAVQAALNCIKKATNNLNKTSRPKVVLVSDTPSLVTGITPDISKFAEVFIRCAKSCYKHQLSLLNIKISLLYNFMSETPFYFWNSVLD